MFVKWCIFFFLLCYDVFATSVILPAVKELDLHSPGYPNNRRHGRGALVIPDEIPSFAHLAYFNLPTIKKGTESRVGFGFAFGNHADFQVLMELGPQRKTKPLDGKPFETTPANEKRQASSIQKNIKKSKKLQSSETDGSKYLKNWAQKMRNVTPSFFGQIVRIFKVATSGSRRV